jgi:protein disulfide-isomerase-like protein
MRGRRRSVSTGTSFMIDAFKRIPKEYQSASYLGGILSATCAAVLTILVLLEFQAYLNVSYHSEIIFPGSSLNKGIDNVEYNPFVSIRFNITFPHLPCEYLSAEMFDVYGRHAIQNTTDEDPHEDEEEEDEERDDNEKDDDEKDDDEKDDDEKDEEKEGREKPKRKVKRGEKKGSKKKRKKKREREFDEDLDDDLEDEFDEYGTADLDMDEEEEGEKVIMTLFKWRVTNEGKTRASLMEEHHENGGEPVHEELPYHHPAHQYREVVPLTSSNFDTFIESKDVVMVDFYAPWCIWCKRLAPVWENFAHEVGEKDYAEFVGVAKVDCTAEVAICRRRRIAGYPSIFLYRDRNPHSHVPYRGDRTTSAFTEFIEGLGVETDHKAEVRDLLDDINNELHAEANVVRKAAFKIRDERKDSTVNHPLKALTAPGGILGPKTKDSALTGIMRALDQAGGSRGAAFRVFDQKNGGSIRIISVRRIPTDSSKREQLIKIGKPLEFHTKQMQEKLGESDPKDTKDADEDEDDKDRPHIIVKQLPTARDAFDEKKEEISEKIRETLKENGLAGLGKDLPEDPDATVPKPDVKTGKDEKKDSDGTVIPLVETVSELATAVSVEKSQNKAKAGSGRRLLMNDDENKNTRIADSALESIGKEMFKSCGFPFHFPL